MKKLLSKFGLATDNEIPTGPDLSLRLSDDPIRNGIRAEQLLNDPLLVRCFENVRATYLRKFEDLPHADIDQLKIAHLSLIALKDVKAALLAYQFNGQTAQKQAERTGSASARPKRNPNLT